MIEKNLIIRNSSIKISKLVIYDKNGIPIQYTEGIFEDNIIMSQDDSGMHILNQTTGDFISTNLPYFIEAKVTTTVIP